MRSCKRCTSGHAQIVPGPEAPVVDDDDDDDDDEDEDDDDDHLAVENFHPKSHWLFLEDSLKMSSKSVHHQI